MRLITRPTLAAIEPLQERISHHVFTVGTRFLDPEHPFQKTRISNSLYCRGEASENFVLRDERETGRGIGDEQIRVGVSFEIGVAVVRHVQSDIVKISHNFSRN